MDATTALAIYRAEKDKALRERRVSHVQLMAEAQEAFRKMLADAQLARKGGRPKGSTNAANAAPAAPPAPPAAPPGKLVLKTTKPSPAKGIEKVTAPKSTVDSSKTAKAATGKTQSRPAVKQAPEKKTAAVKSDRAAKSARRAAAPAARKGSAKKPKVSRKQAAARERKAKGRKR
jgi:hypothetical protein